MRLGSWLLLSSLCIALPATTQEHGGQTAPVAAQSAPHVEERVDIIMPHITDSRELELPWPSKSLSTHVTLPRWRPIRIGNAEIDLSPTKHVVFLLLAGILTGITLIATARVHRRSADAGKPPRGFANGLEAVMLYMRNEVVLPNVGPHGEKYVPFVLTLFFFILFANVLGLVPYGSTATGNISVTATLAVITFFVVEIAGMRTLGKGYINTIVYWPHDMSLGMKIPMTLVITPVELIGKFTKPFALAIRLFANMTAGHVVVLAFIGMIFTFGSYAIAPLPLLMAFAITLLELFVAFVQAFIFAMLASVFIGQVRQEAH